VFQVYRELIQKRSIICHLHFRARADLRRYFRDLPVRCSKLLHSGRAEFAKYQQRLCFVSRQYRFE